MARAGQPEYSGEQQGNQLPENIKWLIDLQQTRQPQVSRETSELRPYGVPEGIPGLTAPELAVPVKPVVAPVEAGADARAQSMSPAEQVSWDKWARDFSAFFRRSATDYLPILFTGLGVGGVGAALGVGRLAVALQWAGLGIESYGFAKTLQTAFQPRKFLESQGASEAFTKEVGRIAQDIPKELKTLLHESAYKVVACDRVSNYLGPLDKLQRPSGYPEGSGWDNCGGVNTKGDIVVAEEVNNGQTWIKPSPLNVTKHEVGHAMDDILTQFPYTKFSKTPQFLQAYQKDKAELTGGREIGWDYYLQKGWRGPSEAFAESFAYIQGSTRRDGEIHDVFPRVIKVIQDRIEEVKKQSPEVS